MVSIDVRTRTNDDVRAVDPHTFLDDELRDLIAARGDLARPGARQLAQRGLRPLRVEIGPSAWTLRFVDDRFAVEQDGDGATTVVLTGDQLADIVNDTLTPVGMFTGGDLVMPSGRLEDLLDWWVVLRSLIDARPVHTAGAIDFRDGDGAPLDLTTAFSLDDDPAGAAAFLAEAGYLHLTRVFTEAEMEAVSAEIDAAARNYTEGDNRSWWASTVDGDRRLVRMQYFQDESPTTAALLADDRLLRIGALTDDGHRLGKPGPNRNLVEALVKPIGVVEGISDVPWHKDCSLGSHSYRCCSLTVGISKTGASADSGQLRVVAGSHRALVQPAFVRRDLDLPMVDLPTATGDVTVHCSCTLHMSQPPVARERRVLYTDFSLPRQGDGPAPGERQLKRIREGAYTTVSQQPAVSEGRR